MNASPGAAVGKAVFDSDTAVEWAERGEDVILVRKETNPDDLRGMVAARGILTSRGGKTSHAAVVARGMGRTCVCGAESLDVDTKARGVPRPRRRDGARGRRDLDRRHHRRGLRRRGAGRPTPWSCATSRARSSTTTSSSAVARIMAHADGARRLRVRTNADTPEDAARARRFGAQGIGLCRTEHMFLGERRELVEKLIVAEDEAGAEAALDALLPLQRQDFTEILEAMDGLPVTIRLLDPPLHEFLPDLTELSVEVALAEERGEVDERDASAAHARPPAARAEPDARPARRTPRHPDPRPVPDAGARDRRGRRRPDGRARHAAAGDHGPAGRQRARARDRPGRHRAADRRRSRRSRGVTLDIAIGTMIELPRAAFLADRIAADGRLLLLRHQRPDPDGVGLLPRRRRGVVLLALLRARRSSTSPRSSRSTSSASAAWSRWARQKGRETKPDLKVGVCGEHGGDPRSIHFFDEVGLNYVSCSPFRVPVARLEAGRSVLGKRRLRQQLRTGPTPGCDGPPARAGRRCRPRRRGRAGGRAPSPGPCRSCGRRG